MVLWFSWLLCFTFYEPWTNNIITALIFSALLLFQVHCRFNRECLFVLNGISLGGIWGACRCENERVSNVEQTTVRDRFRCAMRLRLRNNAGRTMRTRACAREFQFAVFNYGRDMEIYVHVTAMLAQTAQRSHFRPTVWTRVAIPETRLCKCQGLKWNFCVRANITFIAAATAIFAEIMRRAFSIGERVSARAFTRHSGRLY